MTKAQRTRPRTKKGKDRRTKNAITAMTKLTKAERQARFRARLRTIGQPAKTGERALTTLTPRSISRLQPQPTAFYVSDAGLSGLQLRIAPDGSKSWSLRYRIGRQRRRLTLGTAAVLGLADARRLAKDELKKVAAGTDPAQEKQDTRAADTVESFAKIYVAQYAKKRLRRWKDIETAIQKDIVPAWKHTLMKDVTRRHVRELLDQVAERAPITANRLRALLSRMFNIAIKLDIVEYNPVAGTDKPTKERSRDRVLAPEEIRRLWHACDALAPEMAAFWRLRLLTVQRLSEVRSMTWSELDLTNGVWTIPAARAKNALSHRVPLSPSVITILTALRTAEDARLQAQKKPTPSPFVLRSARGKRQAREAAATFGLTDFGGHDLRRSAASYMASSGTPRLVISKILNHVEKGVTAVYDRHSYDGEKKIALDGWDRTLARLLEPQASQDNIVSFTATTARS
jgi:integrase